MKKLTTLLFLVLISLSLYAQERQEDKKQKPKATYQVGLSKVVVWENKKPDGTTWKNFQIEKAYMKEGAWGVTNTFNETELLQLKAAIEKALNEESVKITLPSE